MTTDPGAVPPDAHPLPEKEDEKKKGDWEYEELDNLIKGEVLHQNHHHPHRPSLPQQQQLYSQQQQQQHHASIAGTTVSNNHVEDGLVGGDGYRSSVANKRMEQLSTSSSSLMQEGPEPLDDTPDDNKWNKIGLPQAAATTAAVVAVAAIATGGMAMAGVAAMASTGVGADLGIDVDDTTGRESNGNAIGGLARSGGGGGTMEERSIGHGEENSMYSTSSLHHRGRRMCRRCHAFKPPRAHHCRYGLVGEC